MSNFKKGGFRRGNGGPGGRPSFGGGNKFAGGSGERMKLFPAVCAECKKDCQVPFRPTGDKPVYCRDCFSRQQHVPGRNSNGQDRPAPGYRTDIRQRQDFQPEPQRGVGQEDFENLRRQIIAMESKVNRILELVSKRAELPVPAPKPIVKEEIFTAPKAVPAKATKAKAPVKKSAKKAKK